MVQAQEGANRLNRHKGGGIHEDMDWSPKKLLEEGYTPPLSREG